MKALIYSSLLVIIIAACNPISSSPAPIPTRIASEDRPNSTLWMPQNVPDGPEKTITVLAAASLSEPFNELGEIFEAANPGIKVTFSFAGSQQLAQQLTEGARADVFASASAKYMDAIEDAGKIRADTVLVFASNRLVVIFPSSNPGGITSLTDLSKPDLKLDLAAPEVPVGKYSLDFLDKAANDPAFPPRFKDDVLNNVVSFEDNVKTVLTKVSLGEVDAGLVYSSDLSGKDPNMIGSLDIPDELNVIASYPIAPLAGSEQPDLAQAFVDLVMSSQGQEVLANFGFTPTC